MDSKQLEKEIEVYRTLFLESITTTKYSEPEAKEIMKEFYSDILQMSFPEVFKVFDSPFQAWKWIQENKCENPNEKYVETYAIDVKNSGYYNFYKFALEHDLVKTDDESLKRKLDNAMRMLTFSKVFPFDDCCVVSYNPTKLEFNTEGQLHCVDGKAVEFADGTGWYVLNGITVPEKVVMQKTFTKDEILGEENADIRREILRKIGPNEMVKVFGGKVIDQFEDYELLLIDIKGTGRKYLKMNNPSIDVVHVEGVVNTVNTVKEALAWRNGISEYTKPVELS